MDFNDYIKTYEDLSRQMGGMVLANEVVFHDEELDLYIWGIDHFGTAWSGVPAPELH